MNWYKVNIEIAGEKGFLKEIMEIINSCNDTARDVDYNEYAHISTILPKLNMNETATADKNVYIYDSNINSKGHLTFTAEFGSRYFSNKAEFQNYIEEIFNINEHTISGINFMYDDLP